jgi:hypothetical protein
LCKNCVHFVKPFPAICFTKQDANKGKGKCSLFAKLSMVDGEIHLEDATVARETLCKGKFFKGQDNAK